MIKLDKFCIEYLKLLATNNNREWFNENKNLYQEAHNHVLAFTDSLLQELSKHDKIETPSAKKALNRIYRDTRFSKDKTPYKQHWAASFMRAGFERRGSFYFRFGTEEAFAAGGFWGPEPKDLLSIRKGISERYPEYLQIIESDDFKKHFGELKGEQLKTCPKGFDKEDKAIEHLRYKQFLLAEPIPSKILYSEDLIPTIVDSYKSMLPYFNLMSQFLLQNRI